MSVSTIMTAERLASFPLKGAKWSGNFIKMYCCNAQLMHHAVSTPVLPPTATPPLLKRLHTYYYYYTHSKLLQRTRQQHTWVMRRSRAHQCVACVSTDSHFATRRKRNFIIKSVSRQCRASSLAHDALRHTST